MRAVYEVPDTPHRSERVIYQLEDTGQPELRLRPTVRIVDDGGTERYLYRVAAFSRLTGTHLGDAEMVAAPDSAAEFAARAKEFQSEPFRQVVDELSRDLVERFAASEAAGFVGDLH